VQRDLQPGRRIIHFYESRMVAVLQILLLAFELDNFNIRQSGSACVVLLRAGPAAGTQLVLAYDDRHDEPSLLQSPTR
jgi:hypothetical protein